MPLPPWVPAIAAILIAIIIVLVALDRLGLWMERRGWIYYRKVKPKGSMRAVLGGIEEFLHPEIRHVKEDQSQRKEQAPAEDPSDR
jgi:hypothetical protein